MTGSIDNLEIGTLISNRYEIVDFVGAGGMASVYAAKDTLLGNTDVAIKIIHEKLQEQSSQYQRFLREVQLTRMVTHVNVVRTFDIGQHNGRTYFTMELVNGISLSDIITEKGCLPVDLALYYTIQICQGLKAIHQCGIVHRDLKPPNIIIVDNSTVKITDFGVARPKTSYLTDDNNFCGTLPYVAPEVFACKKITPATDCYSLGVSLYEMLTGELPFESDSPAKLIAMHMNMTPPCPSQKRPDIPKWVDNIVTSLLIKDPKSRASIDSIIGILSDYFKRHPNIKLKSDSDGKIQNVVPNVRGTDLNLTIENTKPNVELEYETSVSSLAPRLSGIFDFSFKKVISSFIIATLITLFNFTIFNFDFAKKIEFSYLDVLFQLRGSKTPPDDVIIISMDEQSYNNLNISLSNPWPRALHAKLLKKLVQYKAKRAVFDILFIGQGNSKEDDESLTSAISGIPTVLGASIMQVAHPSQTGSYTMESYMEPYEPFIEAASSTGLVNLPTDFGRIRRFDNNRKGQYYNKLTIAFAGAGGYQDTPMEMPKEQDLINFYGPSHTIPSISYESVIEDEVTLPENLLKDKIAVIGLILRSSSGPNQKEEFETPYNGQFMFGVEFHATAIDNIIHKEWIKRSERNSERLFSSILILLTCIFLGLVPFKIKLYTVPSIMVLWLISSFIAFTMNYYLFGIVSIMISLPLALLIYSFTKLRKVS